MGHMHLNKTNNKLSLAKSEHQGTYTYPRLICQTSFQVLIFSMKNVTSHLYARYYLSMTEILTNNMPACDKLPLNLSLIAFTEVLYYKKSRALLCQILKLTLERDAICWQSPYIYYQKLKCILNFDILKKPTSYQNLNQKVNTFERVAS